MWSYLKSKIRALVAEDPKPIEQPIELPVAKEQEKVSKPKKPKTKKPKKAAEPEVTILKFDFDPSNPRIGSIELDWNKEFVQLLISHGYRAESEEDIVDLWLNDVCRTIVNNQYQGSTVKSAELAGTKIITKKNLGEGKTEVS